MADNDLQFDPNKEIISLGKHGIEFSEANTVLNDPYAITLNDYGDHDEERYFTIGLSAIGRVLIVNWTIRKDDVRIFSARLAEPNQRRSYYENRR